MKARILVLILAGTVVVASGYHMVQRREDLHQDSKSDAWEYPENSSPLKIFNGLPSEPLPFYVAIVLPNGTSTEIYCGASLIDPSHILTAAHCVNPIANLKDLFEAWIAPSSLAHFQGQKFGLKSLILGPYEPGSRQFYNDIAIIELDGHVQFSSQEYPICIGVGDYEGQAVTLSGFGKFDCYHSSPALLSATGSVEGSETCTRRGHPGNLRKSQVCAWLRNKVEAQADQAPGDSGGPLFLSSVSNTSGDYVQVGLVSYNFVVSSGGSTGQPCPLLSLPGTYTRVGAFQDFIHRYAPLSKFCQL